MKRSRLLMNTAAETTARTFQRRGIHELLSSAGSRVGR
jgi:hypothetical protein